MKTIIPIEENLKAIIDRCEGQVVVSVNEHTASYSSVLDELMAQGVDGKIDGVTEVVMDQTDTMVHVQAHPDSPEKCYDVYHYNVAEALEQMRERLEGEQCQE